MQEFYIDLVIFLLYLNILKKLRLQMEPSSEDIKPLKDFGSDDEVDDTLEKIS